MQRAGTGKEREVWRCTARQRAKSGLYAAGFGIRSQKFAEPRQYLGKVSWRDIKVEKKYGKTVGSVSGESSARLEQSSLPFHFPSPDYGRDSANVRAAAEGVSRESLT